MILKLLQIAGALLMAAGIAAYILRNDQPGALLLLLGMVVYGGARLAVWLRRPDD